MSGVQSGDWQIFLRILSLKGELMVEVDAARMRIAMDSIELTCQEWEIFESLLDLNHKRILDLGCGSADYTCLIAQRGINRDVIGMEIDEIQHQKNTATIDFPTIEFINAGAQNIPLADDDCDVIFMFKSLHHVPTGLMRQALKEVYRVLKPGGYAYISEPVYAGDFNEILRLFHDEREVRLAAFNALTEVVDEGFFSLLTEQFFNLPMLFSNFDDFNDRVIRVTHTDHALSPNQYLEVKDKFNTYLNESGAAFSMPVRVDLLRKQLNTE